MKYELILNYLFYFLKSQENIPKTIKSYNFYVISQMNFTEKILLQKERRILFIVTNYKFRNQIETFTS